MRHDPDDAAYAAEVDGALVETDTGDFDSGDGSGTYEPHQTAPVKGRLEGEFKLQMIAATMAGSCVAGVIRGGGVRTQVSSSFSSSSSS